MESYYNPYRILLSLYQEENETQKSIDLLEKLQALYPNQQGITQEIQILKEQMKAAASPGAAMNMRKSKSPAVHPMKPKEIKPKMK